MKARIARRRAVTIRISPPGAGGRSPARRKRNAAALRQVCEAGAMIAGFIDRPAKSQETGRESGGGDGRSRGIGDEIARTLSRTKAAGWSAASAHLRRASPAGGLPRPRLRRSAPAGGQARAHRQHRRAAEECETLIGASARELRAHRRARQQWAPHLLTAHQGLPLNAAALVAVEFPRPVSVLRPAGERRDRSVVARDVNISSGAAIGPTRAVIMIRRRGRAAARATAREGGARSASAGPRRRGVYQ